MNLREVTLKYGRLLLQRDCGVKADSMPCAQEVAKPNDKQCAIFGSLVLTSLYIFYFFLGCRGPTNGHTTQSLFHKYSPSRLFRSDVPLIVSQAGDVGEGCPKCLEPVQHLSAKLTIKNKKRSLLAVDDTKRSSQVKLILYPKQRTKPTASRTRTCTNAAVCIASGECETIVVADIIFN